MNSFNFSLDIDSDLKIRKTQYLINEERKFKVYTIFLENDNLKFEKYEDSFMFITSNKYNDIYFGLTCQEFNSRIKNHKNNTDNIKYAPHRKLYKQLREYGFDSFRKEKLFDFLTLEEAKATEIYLISKYDTYENGLNSTPGGDNWPGGPQLSIALKLAWENNPQRHIDQSIRASAQMSGRFGSEHNSFGKKRTPEQIANMSGENNSMYGKTYKKTSIQIEKTSGENHGMYGKRGQQNPNFGKSWNWTAEQRNNISGEKSHLYNKTGVLSHNSKPVSVFGILYHSAASASDALREKYGHSGSFIKEWTRKKKHSLYTFYVSKDFYNIMKDSKEDITLEFYNNWLSNDNKNIIIM